jgi:hypothetical protein
MWDVGCEIPLTAYCSLLTIDDLTIERINDTQGEPLSRKGRFGKYGDLKRKSRLRAAKVSLRERLRSKMRLVGARKRSTKPKAGK